MSESSTYIACSLIAGCMAVSLVYITAVFVALFSVFLMSNCVLILLVVLQAVVQSI